MYRRIIACLFAGIVIFLLFSADVINASEDIKKEEELTVLFNLNIQDFMNEDVEIIKEGEHYFLVMKDENGNEVKHKITEDDALALGYKENQYEESEKNNRGSENNMRIDEKSNVLPSTATNLYNMLLIGSLALVSGGLLLLVRNKKKKQKQ